MEDANSGNGASAARPGATIATHSPTTKSGVVAGARARQRTTPICPEPGSLYDIILKNSGTSLFVRPVLWTDHHARVLNAAFRYGGRITKPAPDQSHHFEIPPSPPLEPCETAQDLCNQVSTFTDLRWELSHRMRALKYLMSGFYPDMPLKVKAREELELHFGKKLYRDAVYLPLFWRSAKSQSDPFDSKRYDTAMVGFMDRDHLAQVRQNLFRISRNSLHSFYPNKPVTNLLKLKTKSIMPADPDCDSHIVAILLAMAQRHFYGKTKGPKKFAMSPTPTGSPSPSSTRSSSPSSSGPSSPSPTEDIDRSDAMHDIEVRLFTLDSLQDEFIVYTATIGADFLEGFADPAKNLHRRADGKSSMQIQYTRVPIWPFFGLKERLGKALGFEVTGATFEGSDYDTFHTPEELPLYHAELERIRLEEQRRLEEARAALSSVSAHTLQKLFEEHLGKRGTKRSRDHGSSESLTETNPSTSASKRRRTRGGSGVVEVW